jgi:mannosyltransferase
VSIATGQLAAPADRRWFTARSLLVLIVLAAAGLRFGSLGVQSLWFDEGATHDLVRLSLGDLLSQVAHHESSPPLFYLLEWAWTHVAGTGPVALRELSALAGTLTVPVAFAIGRRLAGDRAGLATAALVAFNPLLVWFSQEARSYALVVLLVAISLWCLLACLDGGGSRAYAAWAVASALALATHYFALFVVAPAALWLLAYHRGSRRARAALVATAAVAAAGLALLPLALAQRGNPYDIASTSIAVRAAQVPKQFVLGYRGPLPVVCAAVAALLLAVGAWLLLARTDPLPRRRALAMLGLGAAGIVVPLGLAAIGIDYLNARNTLPALVPLAATVGVAFGASRRPAFGAACATALCALSLGLTIAVAVDPSYQRQDWRGIARALGSSREPRAVVVYPANGAVPLAVYQPSLRSLPPAGVSVREVDLVTVAGKDQAGGTPRLPQPTGNRLTIPGFGLAQRIATKTYLILRFTRADPTLVTPSALVTPRLGSASPAVERLKR